jgi:hypothetical protein
MKNETSAAQCAGPHVRPAVPVWHEASGQRCRGKKSGIEPNRYGDPKSCDGLTGKQGSANEGRGPGTASFAAGLGESEVGAANSARHAIASGRTA